ncbi:MAG TPA: DUF2173 family protein [Gammaproteobacteria bacterium]|nr:DUF2173 family protein [Gammaproteobacteria bacterium]
MIKRLLIEDGVQAIVHFRDDGEFLEGYGLIEEKMMRMLAGFAHDYSRLVQSNSDQLSMFTGISAWTPPRGWVVRGEQFSVCCVGNLACLMNTEGSNLSAIIREMSDLASY